ncbi:FxsC protein [Actinoplanes sp. DH11]|uniref:FxsC protein n=1 Tax=Actinoplanes sp. DH11 TaxID=2857011 RepID=UPI001E621D45|nr:FxsC protein [Actinoplanes sp. DH11]
MTPSDPARYAFYLSYARTAPMGPGTPGDGDSTVRDLFTRLSDEVRALLGSNSPPVVGHFDDIDQPSADWKADLSRALSHADVFVALYSPKYFNKTLPLQERAAYMRRLTGRERALRLLPVLWVPWEPWNHQEERLASLTLDTQAEAYKENGLRALCRLAAYEPAYHQIVGTLARRIVAITKAAGPRPATPAVIDDAEAPEPGPAGMRLTVMVLAPVRATLPRDRPRAGYGQLAVEWHPFRDETPLSPAQMAANLAEHRHLAPRLTDAQIGFGPLAEGAVLVLVDPWILDSPGGREIVDAVADRLPEWAEVVVIADSDDPQYRDRGAELTATLNVMLGSVRRQVRRILYADQLVERMPIVIDETLRAYLKTAPVFLPKGAVVPMPRITDDAGPSQEEDIDD